MVLTNLSNARIALICCCCRYRCCLALLLINVGNVKLFSKMKKKYLICISMICNRNVFLTDN